MKPELVQYDFSKLNKFIKELDSPYGVDVGIMGQDSRHATGGLKKGGGHKVNRKENSVSTNAEIGFKHEFGRGVPLRSFLRMPILAKSNQILKAVVEAGALKKMAEGNVRGVMSDLGVACETVIGDAFATGGFGDWPPDAPATVRAKHSDAILIDTGQLRRAITSKVVKL